MTDYNENRKSTPSLEWESLPVVGADRPRRISFRGFVWIAITIGTVLIFTGLGSLIAVALS